MAQEKSTASEGTTPSQAAPSQKKVELTEDQFNALMQRLNAVENQRPVEQLTTSGGRLQGSVEKYPTDPSRYPDPTEDLLNVKHPILAQHNLPVNYVLKYKAEGMRYQTADNIWVREPRFIIELYKKVYNDEGEWDGKLALMQKGFWTEDEIVAERIAQQLGIDTNSVSMKELLDRVRFERFKNWLINFFRPRKNQQGGKRVKEELIGGMVTKVTDISEVRGRNL